MASEVRKVKGGFTWYCLITCLVVFFFICSPLWSTQFWRLGSKANVAQIWGITSHGLHLTGRHSSQELRNGLPYGGPTGRQKKFLYFRLKISTLVHPRLNAIFEEPGVCSRVWDERDNRQVYLQKPALVSVASSLHPQPSLWIIHEVLAGAVMIFQIFL